MYSYTLTRQCVENNLQCVEIYLLFGKNKKELKTPLNGSILFPVDEYL